MIELVSVEVENFRSFSQALFTPLGTGQGMTAINGSNGAGKSSLATHALMWALYGVTPDGVPVKAMRRQGSSGEVKATVTFRHQGQEVQVSRMLKGKNDTTIARIVVDGIEQTNVSARTAAAWVETRLGIDAEGFATAFVVRQKELDGLVRARPAERRALIERLAGIDQMSAALAKSRENLRATQNALAALGPIPNIEALERDLVRARDESQRVEREALEVRRQSENATRAYEAAKADANRVEDLQRQVENMRSQIAVLDERIAGAESEFTRLQQVIGAAPPVHEIEESLSQTEEEITRLEGLINSAAPLVLEATKRQEEVERLEAALGDERGESESLKSRIAALSEELSKSDGVELKYDGTNRRLEKALEAIGARSAEVQRLERAIDLLEDSDEAASSCPTCRGPLADPAALVGHLKEERAGAVAEQAEAVKEKSVLEVSLVQLREAQSRRATVIAQRASLMEAEEKCGTRIRDLEKKVLVAGEAAESAAENAHGALLEQQEAEQGLMEARARRDSLRASMRLAEAAVEATESASRITGDLSKWQSQRESIQTKVTECLDGLGGATLDSVRQEVDKTYLQHMQATQAVGAKETEQALAAKEYENIQSALDEGKRLRDSSAVARGRVEESQVLAEAMDEFRKDRLARLAPELSEVASDLLLVMTDGKYSSVDLDEDFTPIIREAETGLERPTAWLSGGEESSVALALRIAIGEVVAGQRGGLLVLDEVLTAQDQLRRNATMTAIRALPRQVIMINHVSEATDLVDLVANVISDGDGGSRVEQRAVECDTGDLSNLESVMD